MNRRIASVVAFAALAGVGAIALSDSKFDEKADPKAEEVKTLEQATAEGKVLAHAVYQQERSDGGFVYAAVTVNERGEKVITYVDKSPCAWKPTTKAACFKVDGGEPGVENTMQAGQWSGAGCVRKACVIVAGEKEHSK